MINKEVSDMRLTRSGFSLSCKGMGHVAKVLEVPFDKVERGARADYIVKCVNEYPDVCAENKKLIKAMKEALQCSEGATMEQQEAVAMILHEAIEEVRIGK